MPHLTIGKLAERTGVSTDTLRYYEKMELLQPGERTKSGYRLYHYDAVRVVRFIRGAQVLQFSLAEIRKLLSLSHGDRANCRQLLKRTEDKIREAETAIMDLNEVKRTLGSLIEKPSLKLAKATSVVDMLKRRTRLLGFALAAVLSCMPDMALADDCLCEEDECFRIERPYKRDKYQPVY